MEGYGLWIEFKDMLERWISDLRLGVMFKDKDDCYWLRITFTNTIKS
jgi:hypothetical protein